MNIKFITHNHKLESNTSHVYENITNAVITSLNWQVWEERYLTTQKLPYCYAVRYIGATISWRMVSSGMLRRVDLVRTDVSEELSTSSIRVTRIGELGTTLVVTSNRRTLRRNTTRAKRRNIPEDTILHSHRRENLKSYNNFLFYTQTPYPTIFSRAIRIR
jgi:membrane protein required for beta-lactamase induction